MKVITGKIEIFIYYASHLWSMLSKTVTLKFQCGISQICLRMQWFLKPYFSLRRVKQTSGFVLSDKNPESATLEAELPHAAELIKKLTSRVLGTLQAQMFP